MKSNTMFAKCDRITAHMYAIHFYSNISCHIDFLGRVNISNRALLFSVQYVSCGKR